MDTRKEKRYSICYFRNTSWLYTKNGKVFFTRKYIHDKTYEERIPIYDKIYSLHDKEEIILYSKYNEYIKKHEDICEIYSKKFT